MLHIVSQIQKMKLSFDEGNDSLEISPRPRVAENYMLLIGQHFNPMLPINLQLRLGGDVYITYELWCQCYIFCWTNYFRACFSRITSWFQACPSMVWFTEKSVSFYLRVGSSHYFLPKSGFRCNRRYWELHPAIIFTRTQHLCVVTHTTNKVCFPWSC